MNFIIVDYQIINGQWTALIEKNGMKVHVENFPPTAKGKKLLKKSVNAILKDLREKDKITVKR